MEIDRNLLSTPTVVRLVSRNIASMDVNKKTNDKQKHAKLNCVRGSTNLRVAAVLRP